jgi:hypothetical protein
MPHFTNIKLELGFIHEIYYDPSGGDPRIFIECPAVVPRYRPFHDFREQNKLTEAIKFAAKLANVRVRAIFIESRSMLGYVICLFHKEKDPLAKKVTAYTLDSFALQWLQEREFKDLEDVIKLERLAGSLSHGLLILFQFRRALAKQLGIAPKPTRMLLRQKKSKNPTKIDPLVHNNVSRYLMPLSRKYDDRSLDEIKKWRCDFKDVTPDELLGLKSTKTTTTPEELQRRTPEPKINLGYIRPADDPGVEEMAIAFP